MILDQILDIFRHLKVMILTAYPLGQEVEYLGTQVLLLRVLDGHTLPIHSMGIGCAHHSTKVLPLSQHLGDVDRYMTS